MGVKTKTQRRVEFLSKCLGRGMSRSEAIDALVARDPRVSEGYARTLVYQSFSGKEHAVARRKKRRAPKLEVAVRGPQRRVSLDVRDDNIL